MFPIRRLFHGALALIAFAAAFPAAAFSAAPAPDVTITGDLRLRWEKDWDSHTSSGSARTDRERARARARLNVLWKASPEWSVSMRARTGSKTGQQSPHLTFYSSDDVEDDFDATLDRYFVQYKKGALTWWAGRNNLPFWQQNELFWDEDVTPTGLGGVYEKKLEQGSLATSLGAFKLPDGAWGLHGSMVGAQTRYNVSAGKSKWTFAGGLHRLDGREDARYLRNRNGARDYLIGILSAQWSITPEGSPPMVFGVDLIRNFESYSAADVAPYAAFHADEKDGFVFSVLVGKTANPKDWQVGYYYAHIETLAVNASYAQDDWARFGSGAQSDLTDIKGHEFRGTYVIRKNLNLQARLFFVDAITSVQDGKRFRVDLNWRF